MCTSEGLRKECFERKHQGMQRASPPSSQRSCFPNGAFPSLDLEQQLVLETPFTGHNDRSHLLLCINPQAAVDGGKT